MNQEINPVEFGIEPVKAKEMLSGLSVIMEEREALKLSYIDVIKLPITEENVSIFKDLRIKVRDNRTKGIEPWHKTNKAFYLAGGRFVDAIKNKEVLENEQMEEKLLEGEKFFENQEKERLLLLKTEREAFLRPFVETIPNGLEDLDQDVFDSFLETKKKAHLEKLELERLEAERIENERLEREKEIEAQRVENERLKAESIEKEKLLSKRNELLRPYIRYIRDYDKVLNMVDVDFEKELSNLNSEAMETMKFEAEEERKRQQSIIDAQNEKDARLRAERELQSKKDDEIKAEKERLAKIEADKKEAEKLAKAPIKKQLSVWVNGFELPKTEVDNETSKEIIAKFEAFKKWSLTQVNNL